MAILRAGPFANSTDSFLDEPVSPSSAAVPVNCALTDWVNAGWRAYVSVFTSDIFGFPGVEISAEYLDGPTLSKSHTETDQSALSLVDLRFYYQATADSTLHVTASSNNGGDSNRYCIRVIVNGVLVASKERNPGVFTEIDEDITLPATDGKPVEVFIDVTDESGGIDGNAAVSSISIYPVSSAT